MSRIQICAYKGCFSSSVNKLKFFEFPNDERKSFWLKNSGNIDCNRKTKLCEKHFEVSDILPTTKNTLKKTAVPFDCNLNKKNSEASADYQLFHSPIKTAETKIEIIENKRRKQPNFSGTPIKLNRDGGSRTYSAKKLSPSCTALARIDSEILHILTPQKKVTDNGAKRKIEFDYNELNCEPTTLPIYYPRNKIRKLSENG